MLPIINFMKNDGFKNIDGDDSEEDVTITISLDKLWELFKYNLKLVCITFISLFSLIYFILKLDLNYNILPLQNIIPVNPLIIDLTTRNKLQDILDDALIKAEADIALIGIYETDIGRSNQFYTVPILQSVSSDVFSVPVARYYLAQNRLFERYKEHSRGNCFIRTFEQSGTISHSCPIFLDEKLWGYSSIEYKLDKEIPNERFIREQNISIIKRIQNLLKYSN